MFAMRSYNLVTSLLLLFLATMNFPNLPTSRRRRTRLPMSPLVPAPLSTLDSRLHGAVETAEESEVLKCLEEGAEVKLVADVNFHYYNTFKLSYFTLYFVK